MRLLAALMGFPRCFPPLPESGVRALALAVPCNAGTRVLCRCTMAIHLFDTLILREMWRRDALSASKLQPLDMSAMLQGANKRPNNRPGLRKERPYFQCCSGSDRVRNWKRFGRDDRAIPRVNYYLPIYRRLCCVRISILHYLIMFMVTGQSDC